MTSSENHQGPTGRRDSGAALRSRVAIAGLFSALVLSGCVSEGETDSPLAGRFTWVSYVSGDDIRRDCEAGSPERYRFVFNRSWSSAR